MSENGDSPKPGHFLPGGAGESDPAPGPRTPSRPSLGQPRALTPSEPGATGQGWHSARHGQQAAAPEPPRRRFGPTVIVGLVAGALVFAGLVVLASSKLVDTFTGLAEGPNVTQPTDRPQAQSQPEPEPSPTETVTAPPPPTDTQVLRQNKLYAAGKLTSSCKEPAQRPTSKANVEAYYRAMMTCLNATWAPVIRKAGHDFRPPRLSVYTGRSDTPCGRFVDSAHYCDAGESVNLPWESQVKDYRRQPEGTRIEMLDSIATVYGFHVQQLAGILPAWGNLKTNASTAVVDDLGRRFQLQANCLGAVFVSSVRASFPLDQKRVDRWTYQARNTDPDDPKTDASPRNFGRWATQGFTLGRPGSCNTWTAPAARVS